MNTQFTDRPTRGRLSSRTLSFLAIPALMMAQWSLLPETVLAQPPYPLESIGSIGDFVQEVQIQTALLEKSLANEESFEKQKGKTLLQSFGLMACLGQALTEHPESAKSNLNGPALRDAALKYSEDEDFDAAKAVLAEVKDVLAGKVTGEHKKEHPWNELIAMYPMMEEINTRNSEILKILKRPRGKPEEISPAIAWGVLALTMKADTQYTSDDDELAKWNGWSDEFYNAAVGLGKALRAQDKVAGRTAFDQGYKSCETCHKVFKQ